eukprot:1325045-Prymnesium_polylepis.1
MTNANEHKARRGRKARGLTRKMHRRPHGKRDSGDCASDTTGTSRSRLHARNTRTSDAFQCAHSTSNILAEYYVQLFSKDL